MKNVTIKGLLAHKLRLALTSLAIVLGVTFIAGTFVLTDTLQNTFSNLFGNIYQKVDFQVRGVAQFPGNSATAVRNPLPESVLATVQHVPGVGTAVGQVEGYAQFVSPDGKAISNGSAGTIGIAFDPHRQISELRLTKGNPPATSDDVVMDAATAQKYHFKVGQSVRILSQLPPKAYTITGIGQFGNAPNLAGATLAAFTLPTAQAVVGEVGQLDYINIVAKSGADKAVVQRDIAHALPPGAEVVTGQTVVSESTSAVDQALSFFSTALLVFAFISLFVGAFTIFNTFSITVGQRTRRAGFAAGRRGQPPPGVPLGTGRGRHFGGGFFGDRHRARRPGRVRVEGALERLWHLTTLRAARIRGPNRAGVPGGRYRRDRHLLDRAGPSGRPYPAGGRSERPPD